jgi:hypothetical protein
MVTPAHVVDMGMCAAAAAAGPAQGRCRDAAGVYSLVSGVKLLPWVCGQPPLRVTPGGGWRCAVLPAGPSGGYSYSVVQQCRVWFMQGLHIR